MSIAWNAEFQKAVDAGGVAPARIALSGANAMHVLLPMADYLWVRAVAPGVPDAALVVDPMQRQYALIPVGDYDRIKPLFEEDPITRGERLTALREAGLRAGWNDPIWDDEDENPS